MKHDCKLVCPSPPPLLDLPSVYIYTHVIYYNGYPCTKSANKRSSSQHHSTWLIADADPQPQLIVRFHYIAKLPIVVTMLLVLSTKFGFCLLEHMTVHASIYIVLLLVCCSAFSSFDRSCNGMIVYVSYLLDCVLPPEKE